MSRFSGPSMHYMGSDGNLRQEWLFSDSGPPTYPQPPPPPESPRTPHLPVTPPLSASPVPSKEKEAAMMMPKAYASLVANLTKLLETGQFSDLKIVCGYREVAVHKNIICCQSKPLMAMCTNGMKACAILFQPPFPNPHTDIRGQESQESVIDLTVDTEPCVLRLVDFFYRCDYDALEDDTEDASSEDADAKDGTSVLGNHSSSDEDAKASTYLTKWPKLDHAPVTPRQLSLHVDMFVLADKYDIASLADLARMKFKEAAYEPNHSHQGSPVRYPPPKLSVLETIPRIYAVTGEHNRGLRDVVVEYARLSRSHLEHGNVFTDKLAELFESVPDFAVEVSKSWLKMPYLGYCEKEHCGRTLRYTNILCGPCREKKDWPHDQFAWQGGLGVGNGRV